MLVVFIGGCRSKLLPVSRRPPSPVVSGDGYGGGAAPATPLSSSES
jgi:hypothetical protein